MDTLQAIRERFSYRGAYKQEAVPREHLRAILEAGLAAPSGCNTQLTRLIAVDDPALLNAIGEMLREDFSSSPAGICVITQVKPGHGQCFYNIQDYAAAIENMLLAITDMGYASCWIEGQVANDEAVRDRIAQVLGVPEGYDVVAYLPVGIPTGAKRRVAKKPFEERAWFNGFGV